MAEAFVSLDDARNRINRTICMYKNRPYYVHVDSQDDLRLFTLRQTPGEPLYVKVTDKDFSYKSAPLGYMNYQDGAVYVMRLPTRQIRAGLAPEVLVTEPRTFPEEFFRTKVFEDCILGRHPSLKDAVKRLNNGKTLAVAVDRHLALAKDWGDASRFRVFYRASEVGHYHIEKGIFEFIETPWRSFLERIIFDLHIQE